nr:ferredoxin reductase [Myxococcota bacterium]
MELARQLASAWQETRQTAASRLLLHRHAELWLRELGSTGSSSEIRARVVDVVRETADARTFVLRPNRLWRGHRAGQWTSVEVEIDGARVRRCYSISSAPGDALVSITVKRVPGGRVSGFLHDRVRPGDVLGLGPASGEFVLPERAPARLLLLGGGSGITPMMSMLRALIADRETRTDVVLVHHARSRDDVIFRDEIDALAAAQSGLRRVWCLDDDPHGAGGFDEARLAALVPDRAERETFLCGPPAMMARVEEMWRDDGHAHRLHTERFTAPPAPPL